MRNNDYYNDWKPLRNMLSKLDLNDTLGVIRAYASWNTFNTLLPFPSDVEVHSDIYTNNWIILPWEMEILAREAIIVSEPQSLPSKSAKKWFVFIKLINSIRRIDDSIAKCSLSNENILQEVTVRLAHQQFRYQSSRPNKAFLIRYSKIFSHASVTPFVKAKTQLQPKQLFTLGAGLWLMYSIQNFGMYYPLENLDVTDISQEDYDNFMNLYALPMAELKALLLKNRKLDNTFKYQFHELQNHPIIFTTLNNRPAHICPIPALLFWRITSGLFYDLVKEPGFGLAYGKSFEEYTGELLTASLSENSKKVYPEEPDVRQKRCDWIIDDSESFLTIECKTKRMTSAAISTLDVADLEAQLDIVADAVVQSYRTIEAYKNMEYRPQNYPYDGTKQPYISVVTLEDWYLMGDQLTKIDKLVKKKLVALNLNADEITKTRFIIMSIDDMESFSFLIKSYSLKEILDGYVNDPNASTWSFGSYLHSEFKNDLSDYTYEFENEESGLFTFSHED